MIIFKAVARNGNGLDFVLSDATVDSYGEVISPTGWDLTDFRNNPVALWDHGHDKEVGRKPIGRWANLRVERDQLIGTLETAEKGILAAIDWIITCIERGYLRATSVGFNAISWEPMDPKRPNGPKHYLKQRLLETSIVAIGANPAALALAKSMNVSQELISRAFGEHAETRRRDVSATGEQADITSADQKRTRVGLPPPPKVKNQMETSLSQKILDTQNDLTAKRDKLSGLNAADTYDADAVDELTAQIDLVERELAGRKASESKIGMGALTPGTQAPAVIRRPLGFPQSEIKASDLLVRSALCHFVSKVSGKTIDQVLDQRYPGHEPTALVTKADATIATTTTAGWASELVNNVLGEFMDLLTPYSIYPGLAAKGVKVTFNNNQGAVTIPSSSSDSALAGGFVLEGDPIPVGQMTFTSITMAPHKFAIITTLTKEAAAYTTPALESVLRRSILRRTAMTLDGLLLDAVAGTTTRPAGLLNGVAAVAAGFGGGDYQAVVEDITALMAPFDSANAGRNMVLIMHPAQARKLAMMPGPGMGDFGWADRFMSTFTVLTSTNATAGRIIAIDADDFATATGDTPVFDVSEQATIHMSTVPLEIVSGTGPTTADPVRSMFQTNSLALRMVMMLTWRMRRSGMIQWIDGTSW